MLRSQASTIKTISLSVLVFVVLGIGLVLFAQEGSVYASTVDQAKSGVSEVGGTVNGTNRVKELISIVVNVLLFLIGSFAVIMIIIAGFRLVTANGDSNTVSSAKNTIIYAVIGIVVAVSAYAIVNFVLAQVT